MTRITVLVVVLIGVFFARPAVAGPPKIDGIAPYGVRRGLAAEVTISGSNLGGNPRLVAPFAFQIERPAKPEAKADPAHWKFTLLVDHEVALGSYPVRVLTDDGISNPMLFVVGQLPQVAEKEDNSLFESAQALPEPPLVVEGQAAGNDVDFFRFRGRKGQTIVIDAQCARIGSGIDPTIRLTSAAANRKYVASADDSPGLLTDARLSAVLPEDGDYVVELSDSRYQGGGRPIYRLVIGAVPMAEEVYPLGGRAGETVGFELRGGSLAGVKVAAATLNRAFGFDLVYPRITTAMLGAAAGSPVLDVESLAPLAVSAYPEVREPVEPPSRVAPPVVLNGRIDPPGDEDRFVVATTPGQRLRITVRAYEIGSALDAVVRVLGNGGAVIASADDTSIPQPPKNGQPTPPLMIPDPALEVTVPGGTTEVTLVVRDLEGRGGVGFPYRVVVEPIVPDFELLANESELNVPRGGSAALGVTIRRTGFTGPIQVTLQDLPAGLSVRPGSIGAGQAPGVLSLSATADAAFPPAPLRLVARGDGPSGPVERVAVRPLVFAQQSGLATCTIIQHGLVTAPTVPTAVTLDVPAQVIEVPHGSGTTFPIKLARTKGSDAAVTISALALPGGVAVAPVTIADKALEGKVTVTAAVAAALETVSIGLEAKGKFGGGEQTIAAPVVTLRVVPPATVELPAPAIEVKPGTTFELKGKLVRKGSFNEPVTVKVNGLPAGLQAEPVKVAPGMADFLIKVVADAKAPAATAATQVVLAFQVEKKDYSVPPAPLAVKVLAAK